MLVREHPFVADRVLHGLRTLRLVVGVDVLLEPARRGRLGVATKSRPRKLSHSLQSGLMRKTTSVLALTRAHRRASLARSDSVSSPRRRASLRQASTRAFSSRALNG